MEIKKWLDENAVKIIEQNGELAEVLVEELGVSESEGHNAIDDWADTNIIFEEDFVLNQECESCGNIMDGGEEDGYELMECTECHSPDLINESSHEGLNCPICKQMFSMWEEGYRIDSAELYCAECIESIF